MKIEPLAWGVHATYLDVPLMDAIKEAAESDITALISITVDYRTVSKKALRGPITCVSVIKALLGVNNLRFTPKMLYKYLCKHDGLAVIKPYVPYVEG